MLNFWKPQYLLMMEQDISPENPLPIEAQFSPVYAACVGDYNGDGIQDILLGGNLYNVKPEVKAMIKEVHFQSVMWKGGFSYMPA